MNLTVCTTFSPDDEDKSLDMVGEGYVSPQSGQAAVTRRDIKFVSVSSLASEEAAAAEKGDGSPMSTLTGRIF